MRIVIVEDEIRIREGLSKLIDKINPEYYICGEAENGEEGILLIEKEKPDLVITDIRMPKMDGLHMLETLEEKKIRFETVILTAYSEFSYAKTALKLGVREYLLKPVSVKALKEILEKMDEQIKKEKRKETSRPEALGTLEHILTGLMLQNLQLNHELKVYLEKQYSLHTEGKFTLIPVYLGDKYEQLGGKLKRELNTIMKQRQGLLYEQISLPFDKMFVFVVYQCDDMKLLERWFQNRILMQLNREKKYPLSIGWITMERLEQMQESLDIIRKFMHWNIVLGEDVMISYPKITCVQAKEIAFPVDLEEKMKQAMCLNQIDKVEENVRKFREYYKNDQMLDPQMIKEHYVRFLMGILNIGSELDYASVKNLPRQELVERVSKSITEAELTQVLTDIIKPIVGEKPTGGSTIIQRAKGFAHEYYGEGITLDEIARKLNLTPEYLGTLFRKEEGINFNGYMKQYRVQKAKEILLGTNLKLYDVANKVGYADPKYFSKVFKEVTGYLPAEYRKIKK